MRLESSKLMEDIHGVMLEVADYTRGKSREEYLNDKLLRRAVERCFEIAGEALTQLRKIDRQTAESITEWSAIIAFRNVLIHGYGIVDSEKTWLIIQHDLPVLIHEVQALLAQS